MARHVMVIARPAAIAGLVLAIALLAPTVAETRVVASFGGGLEDGPALSADGRLVLGQPLPGGRVSAIAVDPSGAQAPQRLATFPAPPAGMFTTLTLTGAGGVVGAQVDGRVFAHPKIGGTELRSSVGRTLLPSTVIGSCPRASASSTGVQVAGGDGFAATIGEQCEVIGGAVRVHSTAGVRTLPTAPGAQTSFLRAAGPYVAWAEVTPGPRIGYAVVLARATGELLMRAPVGRFGAEDLGLGADGTLAWATQGNCAQSLFAASAAQPVVRTLSGPAVPCPFGANRYSGRTSMAVAGGRVVYAAGNAFAVTDGSGTGHTIGELPTTAAPGPIAFDGRTLYGARSDCDADRLLAVDVATPGTPPAMTSPDSPACPVARRGSARQRLDARTRTVRVRLTCPAGCRGTLRLVQQRRNRERPAGQVEVSGRGLLTVRVRTARWAAGLAACGSGLRLRATLHRAALSSRTPQPRTADALGVLRVRSSGRCRHLRAPPFERRVPLR